MKIGIDASRYSHQEATGVEWYSWHIINGLIEEILKREKDDLILYSGNPINPRRFKEKVKNKVLPARRLWTLLTLSREMKKNPPDVLFVPSHTLPPNLPGRSVITIHDVAFKHLRKSYSFFQYHYLNWSTKFAVKNADAIIVPSEATAQDLINFYKCEEDKISVVLHGFEKPKPVNERVFGDSEVFRYFGITRSTPYFLFLGRLESKKNLVRLVEAFAKFSRKYPDYRLVLAGKRGVGFDDVLKTINKLELMHKVLMPGYITEEEKAALFLYAKAFAFPSLYEGFGLPLLEAFYYKIPVLCSNVSSLPGVGEEAVHYVDPYDVEMIAEGLETLAENGEYVNELVKKGEGRLNTFSWEKAAKKTLEILHG